MPADDARPPMSVASLVVLQLSSISSCLRTWKLPAKTVVDPFFLYLPLWSLTTLTYCCWIEGRLTVGQPIRVTMRSNLNRLVPSCARNRTHKPPSLLPISPSAPLHSSCTLSPCPSQIDHLGLRARLVINNYGLRLALGVKSKCYCPVDDSRQMRSKCYA